MITIVKILKLPIKLMNTVTRTNLHMYKHFLTLSNGFVLLALL